MADLSGKTIDQYQLISFIAKGETSLVYKAFHPSMNRYVTVKMLSPSRARARAAAELFRQEAELMDQLEHPNILPVYDHGLADGVSFLVTRYIEGGPLEDRLLDFQTPSSAAALLKPLTEALDYLHARGLVHGNLNPKNILLDWGNTPVLTNIGVTLRAFREAEEPTPYHSPEQMQGKTIDERSDVYALGVLLYELLVGKAPDHGLSLSPRFERPDLPAGVEKVILKAIALNPDQRYQSPGAFHAALEEAVQTGPAGDIDEADDLEMPDPLLLPPVAEKKERDYNWIILAIFSFAIVSFICMSMALIIYLIRDNRAGPRIEAAVEVNIWSGPGLEYQIFGVLNEGDSAVVVGRSANGLWWVVETSLSPNGQGWVFAPSVHADDTADVPVIQPPVPTPTLPQPTPV